MGKFSIEISANHKSFIEKQHLFFVATAPLSQNAFINLSPKGMDAFRVLSPNKVGYMDVIGSGNETSAHVLENGRITFMFCAFEGAPNILRLYGHGETILPVHPEWEALSKHFTMLPSTRQIIVATIYKVQTSCGYGVPLMQYEGERTQHDAWAESIGAEGLETYKLQKNQVSLDGMPTALGRTTSK